MSENRKTKFLVNTRAQGVALKSLVLSNLQCKTQRHYIYSDMKTANLSTSEAGTT